MTDEKIAGPGTADMQSALASWVIGIMVGLVGFMGLFMASRATDAVFYWVGLLFFVFAVLFCYGLIGHDNSENG